MVAFNKIDVPDSGDYYEDVRQALLERGVAEADVWAISAATGQGVTPLVRRLHALLDALPVQARPLPCSAPVRLPLVMQAVVWRDSSLQVVAPSLSQQIPGCGGLHTLCLDTLDGFACKAVQGYAAQCAQEAVRTTEAENVTRAVRRSISDARIDEFEIDADLADGRTWRVTGAAIERFAAMTNWDYYEAAARFQKVLDVSGELGALVCSQQRAASGLGRDRC